MKYQFAEIDQVADDLLKQLETLPPERHNGLLRGEQMRALYESVKQQPAEKRAEYGQQVNKFKADLADAIEAAKPLKDEALELIDVTAPFHVNQNGRPQLAAADKGSIHPITAAQDEMIEIFSRMGFASVESRQLDDEYYMFDSLNFPAGHPARDEYDTFVLDAKDKNGKPLVAPSHTSIMQNRILRDNKEVLDKGEPIAYVVPGRVFRNEDVDARHEHTFYQIEGIYVDKGVTTAHLITTLKEFMQAYYQKDVEVKTQPFYFPFTEPSFEFAISCPFCEKQGCKVCGEGWIELLGCGMIHPNVLSEAGIDPKVYTGFAWGIGFMRMVMIKYGIEDIRHFQSSKLDFLRQFS